jgi:EAL domain-containing protein (putative c-di-GMP-specific phosphodiesterase class I)
MHKKIRLQPLVRLADGSSRSTFGFEALYKRTSDFAAYPNADQILRTVMSTYKNGNNFHLFINMSTSDVMSENFAATFLQAMNESDLGGNKIVLELNENTHPDLLAQTKKTLNLLRTHGVKVALDDFGTQYSNLSFMSELPIDIVKVDKAFVQKAPFSRKAEALLKFCINVSHDIGCEVVAEGLETKEQLECAQSLDADIGQGFLFNASSWQFGTASPFLALDEFLLRSQSCKNWHEGIALQG